MQVSDAQQEKLRLTQEQLNIIEEHFHDLMQACQDDQQRQKVIASRAQAHVNAADASLTILMGNEPQVNSMISSLQKLQKTLEEQLQALKDIVAVIDLLTSAIRLGTRLVALGL
jgi:C4-type Zn-finger protein